MEIVGSVAQDEVPAGTRRIRQPGVWTVMASRIVADLAQGRVTVIKVNDDKEFKKLRNGLAIPLRKGGWKLQPVVVRAENDYRIFCELTRREPDPSRNAPIAQAWASPRDEREAALSGGASP